MRGRLPLYHFLKDPAPAPENIMDYSLDFSKPTTYWGHEYPSLSALNHSGNKLLFTFRNYVENVSSRIAVDYKYNHGSHMDLAQIGARLKEDIINNGIRFQEYINRLSVFDNWDPKNRLLVRFEDLAHNPQVFVPQVMNFIGDDSEYRDFIEHYDEFQDELILKYNKKGNRSNSGTDIRYFSKHISSQDLREIDLIVKNRYPDLWIKYFKYFKNYCF